MSPSPHTKPHRRREDVAHGASRGIKADRGTLSHVVATEDLRLSRQLCRPSRGFSARRPCFLPTAVAVGHILAPVG